MKKISADYIFTGNNSPIKKGVVVLSETGVIETVLNPKIDSINWAEVEQHNGIICPGFINTHCHLELSYLKGKITEQTKLHGFVKDIISIRNNFSDEFRNDAIQKAEQEMIKNGIVAIGDISNGNSTFLIKENSTLQYHTFVEVFGSDPKIAEATFQQSKELYKSYFNKKRVSITPHATYSVSNNLTQLINAHAVKNKHVISLHNQETASENEFYQKGTGKLFDFLEINKKYNGKFKPTKKNALESYLAKFQNLNDILLVHNTFTKKNDIDWATNYSKNIYWCFCPNANEYIEKKQPNYSVFKNEKCTIGTDSLASNWSLSILEELKTISKKDTTITLERLIKWATFNGAQFLGFEKLGCIEKNKKPGLNLIKHIDFNKMALNPNSLVEKLI